MTRNSRNELTLLDIYDILRSYKLSILTIIMVFMFMGTATSILKHDTYQSEMLVKVRSNPPYLTRKEILEKFEENFFSLHVFEKWKQLNGDSALAFDFIDKNIKSRGTLFLLPPDNRKAYLEDSTIFLKTRDAKILENIVSYTKYTSFYVNEIIKSEAKIEKQRIENIIAKYPLSISNSSLAETLINTKRFLQVTSNPEIPISFELPTIPKRTSWGAAFILVFSFIFGSTVAILYALFRNEIKSKKQQ